MARGEGRAGTDAIKELAFLFFFFPSRGLFPNFYSRKPGLMPLRYSSCVHGYYFSSMTNPVQQMHRLSMPVIFYSSGKNESRLLGLYDTIVAVYPSPSLIS